MTHPPWHDLDPVDDAARERARRRDRLLREVAPLDVRGTGLGGVG